MVPGSQSICARHNVRQFGAGRVSMHVSHVMYGLLSRRGCCCAHQGTTTCRSRAGACRPGILWAANIERQRVFACSTSASRPHDCAARVDRRVLRGRRTRARRHRRARGDGAGATGYRRLPRQYHDESADACFAVSAIYCLCGCRYFAETKQYRCMKSRPPRKSIPARTLSKASAGDRKTCARSERCFPVVAENCGSQDQHTGADEVRPVGAARCVAGVAPAGGRVGASSVAVGRAADAVASRNGVRVDGARWQEVGVRSARITRAAF